MAKKIDKELVIESLMKKFGQYDFITPQYLDELVSGFYKESFVFEGISIDVDSYQVANSSYYYVLGLCQNILYAILCKKAQYDEEILLNLMLGLTRTVNFVCRKLQRPTDDPIYDDYLQDCIRNYDLSLGQTLDQCVTKYLMKVFNTHYVVERKETNFVYRETNRKQKDNTFVEEMPRETKVEEPIIDEPKKSSETEIIQEFDEVADDEVVTIEELINNKNEDVVIVPIKTPFEKCMDATENIVGSASYDLVISLFKNLNFKEQTLNSNNEFYDMYVLLRFGFIRDSYYSLEEIAYLCQINLEEVYSYEKYTLELMQSKFNKSINELLLHLK